MAKASKPGALSAFNEVASGRLSDAGTGAPVDIASRLIRIVKNLLSAHIVLARQEASRDLTRIVVGFGLIAGACVLTTTAWFMANATAVVWLAQNQSGWQMGWIGALGTVFGVNIGGALLLAAIGVSRVRRPVMKETRGMLVRTAQTLTGP